MQPADLIDIEMAEKLLPQRHRVTAVRRLFKDTHGSTLYSLPFLTLPSLLVVFPSLPFFLLPFLCTPSFQARCYVWAGSNCPPQK